MILLVVWLCACASALAQETFDKFLVPVYTSDTSGAYGSVWRSELWFMNGGSAAISVFPLAGAGEGRFAPNVAESLPLFRMPPGAPGQFIDVTAGAAVTFNLRVRDVSRSDHAGTAVPVVGIADFKQRVTLLNIPTSGNFRVMVRLYSDSADVVPVRVSLYASGTTAAIAIRNVTAVRDGAARPAYAQFDLAALLPEALLTDPARLDLEAPAGSELWAIASITHNETQHVTIIAP